MLFSAIFLSLMAPCWAGTPLHLLQKAVVQGNLESDGTTMDSAEALAFVEALAEKVAGHNYTLSEAEKNAITAIKAFIDRMLQDVVTQRAEDQSEVNGFQTLIQGCADAASNGLNQVANLESAVGTARNDHSACRVTEAGYKDDMTVECAAYDAHRKLPPGPPACMTSMTGDKVASDEPSIKANMESCLEEIHAWFPPLWELYVKCRDSKGKLDNQTDLCKGDQKDFESDFCQYSLFLTTTCNTQTTCRAQNIDARNKSHAAVKIAEAARATDCEVGHKVKCLLAIFEETDNTKKPGMLAGCKNATHSCPDGITYPPIPDPTPCVPAGLQPCDPAWVEAEYSDKSWFSKAPASACTPCLSP